MHLPYGVERTLGPVVRLRDRALPLRRVEHGAFEVFAEPVLNPFLAQGRAAWHAVRDQLLWFTSDAEAFAAVEPSLVPVDELELVLPIEVADYVDFYSSIHHATNLGRLFRPDGEALLPNWRHIPIGYHGRSGTIVADGADIPRPSGMRLVDGEPWCGPTNALDIELEVGVVVGAPSRRGEPIPIADAEQHLFGLCLVNDWSARDIQAFEYQPLGPFLGKSFATSMSPWIVTLDALEPFRVEPPVQDPPVADHLRTTGATGFDLHLEVELDGEVISRTCFADMYWTPAQQIAHMTTNGANVRAGDLFASGTVSGPTPGSEGSLIELTWRGERPLDLADGTTRSFLLDGDTVTLRGWAGADPATRIGLGSVTGTIVSNNHSREGN